MPTPSDWKRVAEQSQREANDRRRQPRPDKWMDRFGALALAAVIVFCLLGILALFGLLGGWSHT